MKKKYTILYGDVVEFNRLINIHAKNVEEFKSRLNTTILSLAEKYHGKVIDIFNDSSKIIFEHPANALRYTIDIFNKFSREPRIPYRIAISYGEVDFDKQGIYGEPALIAARLIQICPDGSVLFTKSVSDLIEEENDFQTQSVGKILLKGIESQIEVACLINNGFHIPTQFELSAERQQKKSIAVLPFHNSTSEKELEYVCDGLAEEIIDGLTKSDDLLITARSSSFRFKNTEDSILDISRKLNVNYILDGSIRRRHEEYKISFELVDALTGYNVISDSIKTSFDDLYNSEKTIVERVLANFSSKPVEHHKKEGDFYIDPEAYSYYLKGKQEINKGTMPNVQEAIILYEKAMQIVPDYALSLSGLSTCYLYIGLGKPTEAHNFLPKANEYADKAIEIDDTLPEAYMSKALAAFWNQTWDIETFDKNITKALALKPSSAELRMYNGMLKIISGDLTNGIIELKLAKQLDPFSPGVLSRLGLALYLEEKYDEAINNFFPILEMKFYNTFTSLRIAWCYILINQLDIALEYLDNMINDHLIYSLRNGSYAAIYFMKNDKDKFIEYKNKVDEIPATDSMYYYSKALMAKLLQNPEEVVFNLDKCLEDRYMRLSFVNLDPLWKEYHDRDDFQELVKKYYTIQNRSKVKIEAETQEFLEINISDFLYAEAQDNYTLIAYKENKNKKERILRATLANIENQLEFKDIVRCHRSYLVNLNGEFNYSKSDNKAFLRNDSFDISIPVSRSKEKEIKELVKKK